MFLFVSYVNASGFAPELDSNYICSRTSILVRLVGNNFKRKLSKVGCLSKCAGSQENVNVNMNLPSK